jgi:hypothetical protein
VRDEGWALAPFEGSDVLGLCRALSRRSVGVRKRKVWGVRGVGQGGRAGSRPPLLYGSNEGVLLVLRSVEAEA